MPATWYRIELVSAHDQGHSIAQLSARDRSINRVGAMGPGATLAFMCSCGRSTSGSLGDCGSRDGRISVNR